jgi:hypothetical protein
MDLLQSLIVPGTPAYAQLVSSASHQTINNLPEASDVQTGKDSIQANSGLSLTHQQSTPNSKPTDFEEDDEAEDID